MRNPHPQPFSLKKGRRELVRALIYHPAKKNAVYMEKLCQKNAIYTGQR